MKHTNLPYDFNKSIAVDGDGTLWEACYPNPPEKPIKKTVELLRELHKQGWYIIIYSCRFTPPNNVYNQGAEVSNFLDINDVPYAILWNSPGKPVCRFYLDDSAYRPEEIDKLRGIITHGK